MRRRKLFIPLKGTIIARIVDIADDIDKKAHANSLFYFSFNSKLVLLLHAGRETSIVHFISQFFVYMQVYIGKITRY